MARLYQLVAFSWLIAVCVTQVVQVDYYNDDACTDLQFTQSWDVDETCAEADTQDFSGGDFQCYTDQLCFTLYLDSGCSGNTTVGYTTVECTPPSGDFKYYSMLVSGTENCEDADADFVCGAEQELEDDEEPLVVPKDWTIIIFLTVVGICEFMAIIRAILLYKRGPLVHPPEDGIVLDEFDDITLTDLTIESDDLDDLDLGDL